MPVEDLIIEGPISGVSIDRPTSIELDPSLTRELTNCKYFFLFHSTSFYFISYPYQQCFLPTVTPLELSYTSRPSQPT